MKTFDDFKEYASIRGQVRLNDFGYINTRIVRLPIKKLKGMIKQRIDNPNPIIVKEVEFRDLCLSMRSIFNIVVK